MFFLHKKTFDTEKLVHTDCTHKFLQSDFSARRNFTQSSFYTAYFFFAQKTFKHKTNYAQQFLQTDRFYTESSPHRSLTHRRFYAQHFLHTYAFTHRCLYADTNCTQKLVHTARVYTQPNFTQRGFASPSWSPTFRVPPLWRIQPHEWHVYQQVWGHNMEFFQREIHRTPRSPSIWRWRQGLPLDFT